MLNVLKRNNVNIIGTGEKVMLFAHGFGCDQHSWKFIVDAFSDHYKVVLFDYVGSGKSDITAYDPVKYSTHHGYVQDLLDICEELDITNAIFIGHSVSCMIGLLAAVAKPALFEKLVFISPSPKCINEPDYEGGFEQFYLEELLDLMDTNYHAWSNTMSAAIMGNINRPELSEFLHKSYSATDPAMASRFARVAFFGDHRANLKDLTVQSLTLQCRQDMIVPLSVGNYIHKHTLNNKLVVMEATGHFPHISQPGETVRAIRAFV